LFEDIREATGELGWAEPGWDGSLVEVEEKEEFGNQTGA
jgi:hypothetical protein